MNIRISKKLALYLRHAPEKIGLNLDEAGWADVEDILAALRITRAELDDVVATNDKQRFAFSEDGAKIRASQGHSIPVELDLPRQTPPAVLYHGTVARFLDAILRDGLRPMNRHHVHLSATIDTALKVGARRGKPVVLVVDAAAMDADGVPFWLSANGVWLTDHVPPRHLSRFR
ncbi:MAG TPA: RNA 2'-phosphotransferase [Pseudonocardiaceae bacterium]|nr:RNA 2'-phosphotransferase [Pseudonocardiaceae bacterium]